MDILLSHNRPQDAAPDEAWREMAARLVAAPESNFHAWDTKPVAELQRYDARCEEVQGLLWPNKAFLWNWHNLCKAIAIRSGLPRYAAAMSYNRCPATPEPDWQEMATRLLAPPATNTEIWDYLEIADLERYEHRCRQLQDFYREDARFLENWANIGRAIEYERHDLRSRFMAFPPGRPLKEAIRRGEAIQLDAHVAMDESRAPAMIAALEEAGRRLELMEMRLHDAT